LLRVGAAQHGPFSIRGVPPAGQRFAVVVARLDASPGDVQAAHACLSPAERQRAQRLRFERHRRRFIVARARLRQLLAERLGVKPDAIEFAYGSNGKPKLPHRGLHFNVAHCDDVALFAFSHAAEIGVDIEAIRPIREADAIAARFFSPRENQAYAAAAPRDKPLAFLRCWTRKEALIKALGAGLFMPLEKLELAHAPSWRLHSFFPLPGFIAALACHG
jgi:4'-phosphopantetheinyl transferase